MANNKINFNVDVVKDIVIETIKKISLINFSTKPIIEIDPNKYIINIKVNIDNNNMGVFASLSEVQDLVYYKLKEILDSNEITVNVGTIN